MVSWAMGEASSSTEIDQGDLNLSNSGLAQQNQLYAAAGFDCVRRVCHLVALALWASLRATLSTDGNSVVRMVFVRSVGTMRAREWTAGRV